MEKTKQLSLTSELGCFVHFIYSLRQHWILLKINLKENWRYYSLLQLQQKYAHCMFHVIEIRQFSFLSSQQFTILLTALVCAHNLITGNLSDLHA